VPPAPPPSPADLEAQAAALLADAARQEEPAEVKTIEFECYYCGEKVQLSAELAGKKAPCPNPECRRILKVPELKKPEKKDWRNAPTNLPAGAKRPDEPAPEGAWGSTAATAVSKEALTEAEAIPKAPRTRMQKLRPWLLGASAVGVVLLGVVLVRAWLGRNKEQAALKRALDYAASDKGREALGSLGQGALHLGVGEYHLRSKRPDCANLAREHFGLALTGLRAGGGTERDALLGELALVQLELGGAGEELEDGQKLAWNDVQRAVRSALTSIANREARLDAVRNVLRGLLARGQGERVLPLTAQVYAAPGADRQEGLAAAGLEFLGAGRAADAEKALQQALEPFREPEPPEWRPAVVALHAALKGEGPVGPKSPKDLRKPKGVNELEDYAGGLAEGLARAGKWKEAREAADEPRAVAAKVRGLLALAEVAAETKKGEMTDAEAALRLLGGLDSRSRRNLTWPLLRLARRADSGLSEEQRQALVGAVPNAGLRAWGQLVLLRERLASGKETADVALTDKIDPQSLSFLVAREELARHNVRRDGGWADTVDKWEENPRAFGSVGVARGLMGEK
jgi:hypothetical protein